MIPTNTSTPGTRSGQCADNLSTKAITKFNFKNAVGTITPITTITDQEGNPWFVAQEVCEVLGYSNPWDAVKRHVRDHQKNTLVNPEGITSAGNPNKTIINEGGLNRLILRSNLPGAETFQDWVTDEVLPSIRKTGSFTAMTKDERLAALAQGTIELLAWKQEAQPKLEAFDHFLESDTTFSLTNGLKLAGVAHPRKAFDDLKRIGMLTGKNLPTPKSLEKGWMVVKEIRVGDRQYKPQAKLTSKGAEYIRGRVAKGTFFRKKPA